MNQTLNRSGRILELSLSSERPAKDLMEMVRTFTENRDLDGLYDIDIALTGLLVEYIRRGTEDLLDAFTDDIMGFLGSEKGDRLKSFPEGERYFYRWEHLPDLAGNAMENYDPDMTARFIASRKHGKQLLEAVSENSDGIRLKELAKRLGVSAPYLVKLLKEFDKHDLVTSVKGKKITTIHIGFTGRVYLSGLNGSPALVKSGPPITIKPYISKIQGRHADDYHKTIPLENIPSLGIANG